VVAGFGDFAAAFVMIRQGLVGRLVAWLEAHRAPQPAKARLLLTVPKVEGTQLALQRGVVGAFYEFFMKDFSHSSQVGHEMFRALLLPAGFIPLALKLQSLGEQMTGRTVAGAGGNCPAKQRFCRRAVAGFQRQPAALQQAISELGVFPQQPIEQPPRFGLLASHPETAGKAEPRGRIFGTAAAKLFELRACLVPSAEAQQGLAQPLPRLVVLWIELQGLTVVVDGSGLGKGFVNPAPEEERLGVVGGKEKRFVQCGEGLSQPGGVQEPASKRFKNQRRLPREALAFGSKLLDSLRRQVALLHIE